MLARIFFQTQTVFPHQEDFAKIQYDFSKNVASKSNGKLDVAWPQKIALQLIIFVNSFGQ